jgi:hypothetical protein
MSTPINRAGYCAVIIPCSKLDSYLQEVTAEEIGHVRNILLVCFVENEMTGVLLLVSAAKKRIL